MTAILDFAHAFSARKLGRPARDVVRHVSFEEAAARLPIYRQGQKVTVAGWPSVGTITGHKLDRFFIQFPGCTVNARAAHMAPANQTEAAS